MPSGLCQVSFMHKVLNGISENESLTNLRILINDRGECGQQHLNLLLMLLVGLIDSGC